jgi:hypothetical protein
MTNNQSKASPPHNCKRCMLQLSTKMNSTNVCTFPNVLDKGTSESLINTIVGSLVNDKIHTKNHVLSKCSYTKMIMKYKSLLPDLTISMLKNRVYRQYKKHPLYKNYNIPSHSEIVVVPPPPANSSTNNTRTDPTTKPVGRPKGVTYESSKKAKINEAEAKDEITKEYYSELQLLNKVSNTSTRKKCKHGLFSEIKQRIINKRNLTSTFEFSYNTSMK